jgi:hypothetical protein
MSYPKLALRIQYPLLNAALTVRTISNTPRHPFDYDFNRTSLPLHLSVLTHGASLVLTAGQPIACPLDPTLPLYSYIILSRECCSHTENI